ncbi:amidase domain-containing protein [Fredinandcohnia sp. QZ13]|uniref:amidase domain-containing protein n=1 Tax=Fredinandcohnia sp. QZ13 TaxID=3073144 RepID=UPI00285363ED|nr:amidase domain-containing protein [Fredinandcohnia sp. QZ13]MDR4887306.1 amidase domain-containing protein [Fredinandcohnia sp. QZ13]
MKSTLAKVIEAKAQLLVGNTRSASSVNLSEKDLELIQRKKELLGKRSAEIVKCKTNAQIINKNELDGKIHLNYHVHYQYLIRQNKNLYIEEQCEERKAIFTSNKLISDDEVPKDIETHYETMDREALEENTRDFKYNRLAAVQYAERWWNDYNPKYKKFTDNCTNFISQCLHAGEAPMYGYPNRSKGWWMQNNNWSYSWTVANSLRWYLTGSRRGLQAKEVSSPKQLLLGDIICYDFEGDGRFNHNTIVVAKDYEGYPLVNAQTQNSRMRFWSYYDSTAYTPNIKYKFFHIINN